MIEILVNLGLPANDQYVDAVELVGLPFANQNNYGDLNIGAGDHFLISAYNQFNMIYGYTLCSYNANFHTLNPNFCLQNTPEA
jgi:hypothetical protein